MLPEFLPEIIVFSSYWFGVRMIFGMGDPENRAVDGLTGEDHLPTRAFVEAVLWALWRLTCI
jgi:hypothetical protein